MSPRAQIVAVDGDGPQREPGSVSAPPGSLLADLRERATRQRQARTLDLPVGGDFSDRLVIRYKPMPIDELERFGELSGKVTNLSLALDLMLACCVGILGRQAGGELIQLEDEQGPVQHLGHRLAALLAAEPLPYELAPREVVDRMFGDNGFALSAHVQELVEWMSDPTAKEPNLGESSAATA